MYDYKDRLRDIHHKAEEYKRTIKKLQDELEYEVDFIEDMFNRKFKIQGILAKVDDYSIQGNWIDLFPANPYEGVDCLTLTFRDFARQVEFIEDDK